VNRMRVRRALHYLALSWESLCWSFLYAVPYPQIGALSPNPISADTVSVVLRVEVSAFVPQSQILWNQNLFPTTSSIHVTCKPRLHRKHLSLTAAQPEDVSIYGDVAGKHLCSGVLMEEPRALCS
jgi:hypothetical protein